MRLSKTISYELTPPADDVKIKWDFHTVHSSTKSSLNNLGSLFKYKKILWDNEDTLLNR